MQIETQILINKRKDTERISGFYGYWLELIRFNLINIYNELFTNELIINLLTSFLSLFITAQKFTALYITVLPSTAVNIKLLKLDQFVRTRKRQ